MAARCLLTDIDKYSATMKKGDSKLLIRNLRKMKEQEQQKHALDLSNVSGCAFAGSKEDKFNECDKVAGECSYCEHFR